MLVKLPLWHPIPYIYKDRSFLFASSFFVLSFVLAYFCASEPPSWCLDLRGVAHKHDSSVYAA